MRFRLLLLTLVALCTGLVLGLAIPRFLSGPDAEAIRLELGSAMDRQCAGLPEEPPVTGRVAGGLEMFVGSDLPRRLEPLRDLRDGIHRHDKSWAALRTLPDLRRAYLVRDTDGRGSMGPLGFGRLLWLAAILAAVLLLVWLLWKFATILRPFTRVPDLLDADPADVARRALPGQPGIGELLGLDAPEPISAIDNALDRLEREPVPRGPVEEIRAAARNVESMMEAAMAVGSGDLPVVQRSIGLRPLVKEAMARHGVDQLVGGATPELKLPAKVATLVLDRMLEGAGDQARVEIDGARIRVENCRAEPQPFGWNLATDVARRYGGQLSFANRRAEWVF